MSAPERINLPFAWSLLATLDARDRRTALHSVAVAMYARDIAARLGLSDAEQQHAHLCGLVHDIGMIGLPSGLLEKPGSLTAAERRTMEMHSEIGERILDAAKPDFAEVAESRATTTNAGTATAIRTGYPERTSLCFPGSLRPQTPTAQ
jgi:HD-GYP domain-containing protein (c-di-GMP phosphodiesterase class II)